MSIPLIFFHYGDPAYLKYSLSQAKYFNPNAIIYLLGDDKNKHYPFVTHVAASKYAAAAAGFISKYEHLSTNDRNYELNCFLRWFYVQAFCSENNIGAFFYLDSDVLAFQDLSEILPLLQPCKIANTCNFTGMPALTYFNDKVAISDFCDHLIWSYSDPVAKAELEEIYRPYAQDPTMTGGVSDMVLFHTYFKKHPTETLKLDHIGDDLAVDISINRQDGYEMENNVKKVYWQNNLPYCRDLLTNRLIRFITLHYQGDAKKMMPLHYKGPGYAMQRFWDILDIKARFKKFRRSVKKLFK